MEGNMNSGYEGSLPDALGKRIVINHWFLCHHYWFLCIIVITFFVIFIAFFIAIPAKAVLAR